VFEALAGFEGHPRVGVLGGGPIGVELAQALGRLGARVTILEALERILPREDADAAAVVDTALRAEGVEILAGTRATRIEAGGALKGIHAQGPLGSRTLDVEHLIVATGRVPQVADLGLEAAGIATGPDGIVVDARMRTTSPSVFACGDVCGPYRFTHMANQQARVVIQNALFPVPARMDYGAVPWCTFTDPELARVGLNETEAAARGIAVRAIRVDLAGNDRAVCEGETAGFLKLLTPPGRDGILGATLVGAHAGELIHEALVAMHGGLRLRDLAATVHVYPTFAEAFRRAGDESRKAGFTPALRRLLGRYFAWRRA
jgi:pyruvate/2-oxoglutarate dehydrogenase complex dihydrolipoamide dehydrogenase (E3) component